MRWAIVAGFALIVAAAMASASSRCAVTPARYGLSCSATDIEISGGAEASVEATGTCAFPAEFPCEFGG